MYKGDELVEDNNLLRWEIVSVNKEMVEIDLFFNRPLHVSQGDDPEKLIVQMQLSSFQEKNQATIPLVVNKIKDIRPQASSSTEAEVLSDIGGVTLVAAASTCAVELVKSFLKQSSLSHLWSMLNSQQMVVHMPMFEKLKFPANAMTVIEQMVKLATFDLIPTESIDDEIYDWPDEEPYSVNFESAGVESKLFLSNIGFAMYLI